MSDRVQRAAYRIMYPTADRPRFVVDDRVHDVIDCSEYGLRFRMTAGARFERGQLVKGVIRFRNGLEQWVEGTVIRIQDGCAALQLSVTVPFAVIIDEQRSLRLRYLEH